jgi:hypothetical protein
MSANDIDANSDLRMVTFRCPAAPEERFLP